MKITKYALLFQNHSGDDAIIIGFYDEELSSERVREELIPNIGDDYDEEGFIHGEDWFQKVEIDVSKESE